MSSRELRESFEAIADNADQGEELTFDPVTGELVPVRRDQTPDPDRVPATQMAREGFFGCRRVAAACAATLLVGMAAPPAAAVSFQLCYERLKQFSEVYAAMGSARVAIVEPVDDPESRRYILEITIGPKVHRFTCSRRGSIERLPLG